MNRLPIERVLNALKDSTGRELVESGSGWMACCPAHDDHNPSLSVSVKEDGRVLLNCFSECSTESVLAALGLTAADLFPKNPEQTTVSMSMKPQ
ncbi:MAG: CHC2 zinc finger domain-containing protein, partial [Planctomycetota bacterium]|nr:CHC2 zinc finger domain-containing protein [Planctomycetota bacterium]